MENDQPQGVASADDAQQQDEPLVSVTFETVTFSDGTSIDLDARDIVVFVGPNNAGKSLALREIEGHFGSRNAGKVITAAHVRTTGSVDDLILFLEKHAQRRSTSDGLHYHGLRYNFLAANVKSWWPGDLGSLRPIFCLRVATESRITDSNHTNAIAIRKQHPQHPIHLLWIDEKVETRISGYFKSAFNEDLILFRAGGKDWELLVGARPALKASEHMYTADYNDRLLESSIPLEEQGDGMRSFASVILHLLAPGTPSVLLLDEPEAFLHPPQARLLGEFIARERTKDAQLFVASHSADVLQGLLNAASKHLRVIRIQRDGNINRVMELDKERTKEIAADPLMKFSNVLSGIFYQRVIIGEADADCLFYSAILDQPSVRGDVQPDVLFIHGGGKDRLAKLASALRALDVDVDVVADIDILRDDGPLQAIVLTLGGDWPAIQGHLAPLRTAIEQQKPWLNAQEVANGIKEILVKAPSTGEFPDGLRKEIAAIFRKASPWDAVKDAGDRAIPAGEAMMHWTEVHQLCAAVGLWIVPVGEVEGFCKSIGGHGPRWVQKVIETKDLDADDELDGARTFVRRIWKRPLVASAVSVPKPA